MEEQLVALLEGYDGEFLMDLGTVESDATFDVDKAEQVDGSLSDSIAFQSPLMNHMDEATTPADSEGDENSIYDSKQRCRSSQTTGQRQKQNPFGYPDEQTKRAQVTSDDERKLNPLEMMRKKNRENLRRARKLERDRIERMKKTLQDLIDQYKQLSINASRRRFGTLHDQAMYQQLEKSYYEIADLSHRMHEERFTLTKMLAVRQKYNLRIQQTIIDHPSPSILADPFVQSDYEYIPITEDVAMARIWRSYEQIRWLEKTAQPLSVAGLDDTLDKSRPSTLASPCTRSSKTPLPRSSTFGWEVLCKVTAPNTLFTCISKSFYGVQVQEVLDSMWSRYTKPKIRNHLLRHNVLHVFNETTVMSGVDLKHPIAEGKIIRVVDLSFRLETEVGFSVGLTTIKCMSTCTSTGKQSLLEHMGWTSWFEFIPEKDVDTGLEGFRLKFYTHSIHKIPETMYTRLLNILQVALKWENEWIPNSWKLLP